MENMPRTIWAGLFSPNEVMPGNEFWSEDEEDYKTLNQTKYISVPTLLAELEGLKHGEEKLNGFHGYNYRRDNAAIERVKQLLDGK